MTTAPLVTSAVEAFQRYSDFKAADRLTQGAFHVKRDGRQLACALGVLGDAVRDPDDCPAAIMPRWLAQMVPGFFDRQKPADAFAWGERFYAALARIDGKVPFSVVHDWHANTVTVLGMEAAEKRGQDTAPHKALQALHQRALGGEKISAGEWCSVLRNADADADAEAYAHAYDAYAYAHADADADADEAYAYAWKRLADGMVDALDRVAA